MPTSSPIVICWACSSHCTIQPRSIARVATSGRSTVSAIFYHGDAQRRTAEEVVRELEAEHVFDDPIVTKIEPLQAFYPAEEYHREYYRRNQNQPYCRAVIAPKVAKLRNKYLEKLKA